MKTNKTEIIIFVVYIAMALYITLGLFEIRDFEKHFKQTAKYYIMKEGPHYCFPTDKVGR